MWVRLPPHPPNKEIGMESILSAKDEKLCLFPVLGRTPIEKRSNKESRPYVELIQERVGLGPGFIRIWHSLTLATLIFAISRLRGKSRAPLRKVLKFLRAWWRLAVVDAEHMGML